ncbi:hypothetical protein ACFQ5N_13205 [Lutibacter holmesii]|uniref:HEPN domain-containing protein n=1 Tax=Lutibacter holmesii TaxID=1137985 RepID=A0ABW3WRX5_9FLAO
MANKKLNWTTWLQEGDQYLKAYGTRSRFGTEIRYNLISMSFEAYAMAILDFHNSLPNNHTYSDLMYALETVITLDESLKNRILKYENIQSICSIEKYHTVKPTEEELTDLKGAILEISDIAHKTCSTATA